MTLRQKFIDIGFEVESEGECVLTMTKVDEVDSAYEWIVYEHKNLNCYDIGFKKINEPPKSFEVFFSSILENELKDIDVKSLLGSIQEFWKCHMEREHLSEKLKELLYKTYIEIAQKGTQ